MDADQFQILTHVKSTLTSGSVEQTLTQLIRLKDQLTFHHSNRVAEITEEWVRYQKSKNEWPGIHLKNLVQAARLHDVGKIGVTDELLQKTGALDEDERVQMNLHAEIGYELIRDLPGVSELALAIRHHHERWDGRGYPLGLKKDQIPLFAQIIAIVDAYDAMTTDRPYQKARTRVEAIREIKENAGRQFSPGLAEAFIQFLHARNL